MSKYVCDYDSIDTISKQIKEKANNMTNFLNQYIKEIESSLSRWNSDSKESFIKKNNEEVAKIKNVISNIEKLSEFLSSSSTAIKNKDDDLSKLNI